MMKGKNVPASESANFIKEALVKQIVVGASRSSRTEDNPGAIPHCLFVRWAINLPVK